MPEPAETHHATDRPALTRSWIIAAFNRLVLGRRYESVSVGEVTRKAGVGRSTFYEHFRDKDDVLRQAIAGLLAPLADAAVGRGDAAEVRAVLHHIAENLERSTAILDGPTRAQVEYALADLVLVRLAPDAAVPPDAIQRLNARRLAGSHLAVLRAWLGEPDRHAVEGPVVAMLIRPESVQSSTGRPTAPLGAND